jgi:PhoH-like ATPase
MRLRLLVFFSFLFPITAAADNTRCADLVEGALVPVSASSAVSPAPKFAGKVLIFDTNVIMNDPYSIYKYPGAKIIIPGAVMVEIDNHKKDPKTGRAVRTFSRIVSDLITKYKGINKPAPLDDYGTTLMVDSKNYMNHLAFTAFDEPIPDNQIIATALQYAYDVPNYEDVFLVSDDINARVKASSVEVQVMGSDYEWVTIANEEKEEQQVKRLRISEEDWTKFRASGDLALPQDSGLQPNDFAVLQIEGQEDVVPDVSNVVRYNYNREAPEKSTLHALLKGMSLPFPPKNLEQAMALDVLLDPSIDLVISQSSAGTGKTFITMMAGLLQTRHGGANARAIYDRMIVSRTLVHVGKTELGTLPGGADAKLAPFNENYADAWDALSRKKKEKTAGPNQGAFAVTSLIDKNYKGHPSQKVPYSNSNKAKNNGGKNGAQSQGAKGGGKTPYELLAFPNIRGRSINDSFIILDEAQNTSMHEMKTFLTRAGEGTKMILLGDASQVDATFLNEYNNGLSIVSSLVKTSPLSPEERSRIGMVKLTETVRSALADLAVKLFDSHKNE